MLETATGLHVGILMLSAGSTAVLAGYLWRHRTKQAVLPFLGLLVAFALYSGAHLGGLLTQNPQWRTVWENVQWIGTAAIPLCWLVFAIEYTGHDELIDPRVIGALAVVPVVTVLLAWTNPAHGYLWSANAVQVVDGLALVDQTFGPWFWVFTVYTFVAVAVGAVLLLRLIWLSDFLYVDQAGLLLVGVTVPLLASVLTIVEVTPIQDPTLDLAPYSFAVSGLAFGYGLFRHRLLDLVPATRQFGRTGAIRDLEDGVLVVDTNRRVIYLNPAAADQLACEAADALGQPVESLVGDGTLDFNAADALAEFERESATYSVRTSPITDRWDRVVGHTIIVQDVTNRKRRERRVRRQRDELEQLNDLNALIRGVNRALVSATSRDETEQAVCESLVEADRYQVACAADLPTWNGNADRWTIAGTDDADHELPTAVDGESLDLEAGVEGGVDTAVADGGAGSWTLVPIVYGRTVYGALGLFSAGEGDAEAGSVTDRERAVLGELGELIGQTINAVENRRLLAAESVVELEFECQDDDEPLLRAASRCDCRLEITGLVPDSDNGHFAYVYVDDGQVEPVAETLRADGGTATRLIRAEEDNGLLEWTIPHETMVGMLVERGANVLEASAANGTAKLVVEISADTDVRTLVDRLRQTFPDTLLQAKRERARPIDSNDEPPGDGIESLTDRQAEALEAAYRAGYFEWPRESTAEEVADTLDIAPPTLHGHLRKAESSVFEDLFDSPPGSREE